MFPEEQKGYHKSTRETEELQHTYQYILNESKMRRKNLVMAWIDNKKSYDMVPQSWIIDCRTMYKISDEENYGNMESGIDSWRKKLCRNENPERYWEMPNHNYYLL